MDAHRWYGFWQLLYWTLLSLYLLPCPSLLLPSKLAFMPPTWANTKSDSEIAEGGVDKYPWLNAFSGSIGFRGTVVELVANGLGFALHISEKIEGKWAVLLKRWMSSARSSDWIIFTIYPRIPRFWPAPAKNMIWIAMIKITLAKYI